MNIEANELLRRVGLALPNKPNCLNCMVINIQEGFCLYIRCPYGVKSFCAEKNEKNPKTLSVYNADEAIMYEVFQCFQTCYLSRFVLPDVIKFITDSV